MTGWVKGAIARKRMLFHDTQNAQNVESNIAITTWNCMLNNTKEIQQKEREAWMDTNGQDWNGLYLGNPEKSRPDIFQVYGKSLG